MRIPSFFAITLLVLSSLSNTQAAGAPEHERLQIKNTFAKPEDVVRYYCGRDASGFVWSGFLDVERQAFTLWKESPQRDSFLIARQYQVKPARIQQDEALVDVNYDLAGMGDPHGTRLPAPSNPYQVTFSLKKVAGAWKIQKPSASEISPVVMESKFPTASP